jgi:hypothetical protein
MTALEQEPPAMRRSTKVALVLLGTAGVVGVASVWDAWRRARERNRENLVADTLPEAAVSTERTYTNNEYIPGAGYYHAPFFGWYPFPWNFHNPARGYFAGGQWHNTPMNSGVLSSQPTPQAVAAAAAMQRARQQEQQRQARTSGFTNSSNRGSSFTSRPTSTPSTKPSTTRGGFGSSSRGSSS